MTLAAFRQLAADAHGIWLLAMALSRVGGPVPDAWARAEEKRRRRGERNLRDDLRQRGLLVETGWMKLGDWIPAALALAPSTGDSFFGVDRSFAFGRFQSRKKPRWRKRLARKYGGIGLRPMTIEDVAAMLAPHGVHLPTNEEMANAELAPSPLLDMIALRGAWSGR